jgi:hypothetical protein
MHPYRLMMLQHLKREDHTKRLHFCVSFQDLCGDNDNFLKRLRFSDEATFHVSGKVNKQNVRIWGTKKPHRIVENERDSLIQTKWCCTGYCHINLMSGAQLGIFSNHLVAYLCAVARLYYLMLFPQ